MIESGSTAGRGVAARVSGARAVAASMGAMAVLVLLFFYVPHWILSLLHTPARGVRVWLATGWVVAALVACSYVGWRTSGAPRPRA